MTPNKTVPADSFTAPSQRPRSWVLLPTLVTSVLILANGPVLAEAQKGIGVVPPGAKFQGKSYSEWAASFWQWMMGLPLEGHPLIDDPNYDFSSGQSGSVWFQAAPPGVIKRKATIPAGKALFLTIRDVDTSSLEDPPFFGATEAEQRSNSTWFADHIVTQPTWFIDHIVPGIFCIIDGVSIDLHAYRFSTPQFQFTAPTPWIFGNPDHNVGGIGTAVGEGYFLMLSPMSAGAHTIHFSGTFLFQAGELAPDPLEFIHDITIELTVLKQPKDGDKNQDQDQK